MKLLAVGDIHLGRIPSRLPEDLASRARELGPAEAWRRTVEAAIAAGVKAVLLAGDVVEKEDDFFEAYRELNQGVKRLADAGIAIIGVAGNHDVRVLPRLAEQIPQFQLLGREVAPGAFSTSVGRWSAECQPPGRSERWERCEIRDGNEVLSLWGWSFPRAQVNDSPLNGVRLERGPGVNLGLLHCDRGVAQSPYAPVPKEALEQAGLDGWLLGHIHKPDELAAPLPNGAFSPNGYLGSLTGLDRGETGRRGPWLINLAGGRITSIEQLPLAPLRWEHLEVPLDGLGAEDENPGKITEEAQGRLLQAVREFDARLMERSKRALEALPTLNGRDGGPAAVGLRVRFTGRTRFGSAAVAAVNAIPETDRACIHTGAGNTQYFVESVQADTRPEMDLRQLAERQDPVGLLAQRLLWLEQAEGAAAEQDQTEQSELANAAGQPDHEQRDRLIEAARRKLAAQANRPRWNNLEATTPDPVEWLRKSGFRALDRLLAQEAGGD